MFAISEEFVFQSLQESWAEVTAFLLGAFEIIFNGIFALTFLVVFFGVCFFAVGSISLRIFAFALTRYPVAIFIFVLPT